MINFFKDLKYYYLFRKTKKNYTIGFFSENNFIFQYLEPYIKKKVKKNKVLILSFEKIEKDYLNSEDIFVFKTKFFQQIIFLTLNLKYLYSSTPNLNHTIFQKTKTSKCKYIYLSHTPVSMNLIYSLNAFDHFDAIQVISSFQFAEMNEIKLKRKLKIKIFKSKYLFVDKIIKNFQPGKSNIDVLIAPTWNSSFYKLNCHKILSNYLKEHNINFVLRPHPMSIKKNEISISDLKRDNINIDNKKFLNFKDFNFLISDWSGIFIEYAMIFKRKAFLINTPKKMNNKDYLIYKNKPIEITLRNILAKSYELKDISSMIKEISNQVKSKNNLEDSRIKKILSENFY